MIGTAQATGPNAAAAAGPNRADAAGATGGQAGSASAAEAAGPDAAEAVGPDTPGQKRPVVLVVDDDEHIRMLMRIQLGLRGYDVVEAADGVAALEACAKGGIELALLDIEMPGLDGYEVLTRIKADERLREVPVVLVTARTLAGDVVRGLGLGAHDYLRKPFESSELLARADAALKIKRLQDELRQRNADLDRASRVDSLTGIHNRHHLNDQLDILFHASGRHGTPLGVVMVDVDHFKAVNDTLGHAAGDEVLRVIASRLRHMTRREDVLGRWGGEEFLILAPTTDQPGAQALAERMRAAVADAPVELADGSTVAVTVSIGWAVGTGGDPDDLVECADAALYRAKAAGRNRVEN